MALPQETFLGASIRGFDGSIGWGDQVSTVGVNLVEDPANNDDFDPPSIGTAVNFSYDQWQFTGILQGYQREYGQQGNPIYSVQLKDPRELLSGVQLILNDYTGSTMGIPNLYNIYGYLESLPTGFGSSQVNDSGMPWMLLRNAFYTLQLITPIYFRGAYYLLDPFINLPLLPSYYRVGGDSISALEYIDDICEAISCDFFIDMIPLDNDETPATNVIRIRLVNRNYSLRNNAINDFVAQTDGAVAKKSGYELSTETMSRFVVGGKVNSLYFQLQNTGVAGLYDDVIIPFWGWDASNNLVIGTGDFNGPTGKEYQFTIDGRTLYLQTNNKNLINYRTDLAEMHAARAGQDSWESFLWFYNDKEDSIHKGKAKELGLTIGKLSDELLTLLSDWKETGEGVGPDLPAAKAMAKKKADNKRSNVWDEENKKRNSKVFAHINKYATEYYGKKFMVRVPFVAGAPVPETNKLKFSLIPSQTGYVEETYWSAAALYGYMPYNPEKFTDQSSKIYPYARFANMHKTEYEDDDGNTVTSDLRSKYAFDKLSLDSYILDQYPNLSQDNMRENLFVKATIEDKLVFLNPYTLLSPRAVITLAAPIPDAIRNPEVENRALLDEIKNWLMDGETALTKTKVNTWAKKFGSTIGMDFMWKQKEANFNIPDMAAIPLESQILRYGPWYVTNGAGKVEFENDSSLVPWGYGGFTAMNYAGWAKVNSALVSQQVHENGSIEFPGVPTLSLGSSLLSSGPIVTDINVTVGEAGVTTTYRMNTWTHQFGRIGKYNVDRFKRWSLESQKQRKAFRQVFGYRAPLNYYNVEGKETKGDKKDESDTVTTSEMTSTGEGDDKVVLPSTAMMPMSKLTKLIDDDTYSEKGAISMDGLYVPYTTNPDSDSEYLPKFEEPEENATTPTVDDLNPFGDNGVGAVLPDTEDGEAPDDLADIEDQFVKSVALRTPLVLGGWGYDTVGNPVPASEVEGEEDQFATNYKKRADLWKVGPLDLRWDDDRKLWTPLGGGGGVILGRVYPDNIAYGGNGSVYIQTYDETKDGTPGTKPFSDTTTSVIAYEFCLSLGEIIYSNSLVAMTVESGKHVIIHVVCPCGN